MESRLIDARNFDAEAPAIMAKMSRAILVGFDIETQDADRHPGLNAFMKTDEEGRKAGNRPLVFDVKRTKVTGFSIYIDGDNVAYYVNLNHYDVENRLPWDKAKTLLDAKAPEAYWVCHNLLFELVMMKNSLGYDLGKAICTMQMAISAHSPDEYDVSDFQQLNINPLRELLPDIMTNMPSSENRLSVNSSPPRSMPRSAA